ncbi:Curved DNA-binding protein (42 kDa protein) [Tulasnella sp. 332]|nr:Curved DNA-binding protein (42 kDa protein) [Tulasnella sp. 332]
MATTTEKPKASDATTKTTKPDVEEDDEEIIILKKAKKEERSPEELHKEMLQKYKAASDVVHKTFETLVKACVDGASIMKLCVEGDEQITQLTSATYNQKVDGNLIPKGVAFPTCISVNNVVSHFSPLESDTVSAAQTLATGDVVKIQLGAHIDGFAALQTETMIIGATATEPATGRKADVVKAAWHAAQIAIRQMTVDEKNSTITESVTKVAGQWDCKPVEGMLSCQFEKNAVDGKKRIIQAPTQEQKSSHEKCTFAENEVYGVDVLISSHTDGKSKTDEARTTVFQRISGVTYQLKLKTSRAAMSEAGKKAGYFPFNVRSLEDEKRARMGLLEAEKHGVVRPYEITYTHKDAFVAAFMYTVLVTADGPVLLTQPSIWYSDDKLKTEKSLEDADMKKLLEKTISVSDVTGTGAKRKRNTKKKSTGAKEGAVEGEAK